MLARAALAVLADVAGRLRVRGDARVVVEAAVCLLRAALLADFEAGHLERSRLVAVGHGARGAAKRAPDLDRRVRDGLLHRLLLVDDVAVVGLSDGLLDDLAVLGLDDMIEGWLVLDVSGLVMDVDEERLAALLADPDEGVAGEAHDRLVPESGRRLLVLDGLAWREACGRRL